MMAISLAKGYKKGREGYEETNLKKISNCKIIGAGRSREECKIVKMMFSRDMRRPQDK